MTDKPEEKARAEIDRLLQAAGWAVQDVKAANIHAARGVALRKFQLKDGYGEADYLLYVDAKAAGVIEAKKVGTTLTGVEIQSGRCSKGLPDSLPAWRRPLPFLYESTGFETHFTNGFATPPGRAIDWSGRPFVQLVLEALDANRITSVDAGRYLDLKFEHFGKLRDMLAQGPIGGSPDE